jgi:transposase
MPCVLGHALYRQAIHGGTATNDTIDSHKIAVRLRGGMLPQASVYPAAMWATRDLLRRRWHLTRQRAARRAHVQQTNRQSNRPEIGKPLADTATRDGVAERCPDLAVQKRVAVDLALIDSDDQLLSDVEGTLVQTATPHQAQPLYRRHSSPGIGKMLSLVLRYEIHAITRFPRVQAVVSSCRLVKGAKESAGQRDGTSGATIGHPYRTWAFSEAAVLCLRNNPAAQNDLVRLEAKPGQGKALTIFAPKLARAVSDMRTRDTTFNRQKFLNG